MVGHRVDNCRNQHRQLSNCRHAVTAFKPQRNVEKSPPASLHITKPNSDCIPVARSLDICRETRRKVDTFSSGRDSQQSKFFCLQSLAPISAQTPTLAGLLPMLGREAKGALDL